MVSPGAILIASLCSSAVGADTLDTTTFTATSATRRSCDQAILDFEVEFFRVCAMDGEECPTGCYELIDQLNVVCDGARVDFGVYEAGFIALALVEIMLEEEGLPCTDVPFYAFFTSAAFKPSCSDTLAVASVLLNVGYHYFSPCQAALLGDASCPEECESLLGAALATCSAADLPDNVTNWFGFLGESVSEVSAEELLARVQALVTPSCVAVLEAPFLTTTATSTSSFTTLLCQGDRLTFDAGYGQCSTYAPGEYNAYYCDLDLDEDTGLYPEQVCIECGACYKVTETESSTTTETGTTTTTTDTTSSATTTTSTTATSTATSATRGPCDQAILDFQAEFVEVCAVEGEECPTGCYELIDQLNIVCDGVRVNIDIGREEYEAGLVTLSLVEALFTEGSLPCADVPLDAFFSSAAFEPTCADALALTSVLLGVGYHYVSPCQEALSDDASCPQECGSLLAAALATCSAADLRDTTTDWLVLFDKSAPEVSTEELLARVEALIAPSCAALLQMPFSTTANTYTTTTSSGAASSSTTNSLRGSGSGSTDAIAPSAAGPSH